MKISELRERTMSELKVLLQEQQERLRGLRFKVASEEHKDVRDIRQTRAVVARIKTLLTEKEHHGK